MNEANLVEVVGVEPTMFLMWRIYSPLPSTNSAHSSKIVHTLRYAFRHRSKVNEECVLKHTRLVALSPKHSSFGICFNTLPFFPPQKEFHPVGRPFVHVLSADWDLVSLTLCTSLH